MELIPPENQQNLNPNPVNPDTVPETSNQPENQLQAQQSKLYKIFDFIRASIFELFLVALFSILILTTFNYFNLIPLSSVFPALSILPQQQQSSGNTYINNSSQDDITFFNSNISSLSACNPIPNNNIILNPIINCKSPTKIINTGKNTMYTGIPNTNITGNTDIQINFALKITIGKGYQPDGLMFGGDPTENRMYISYDNGSNSWGIQFLYGKTVTQFQPFYSVSSSSVQRVYFSALISKNGKQITILSPNGLIQAYSLKGSLYAKDGTIPVTAVVNPNSEVDIYSLNYYAPQ